MPPISYHLPSRQPPVSLLMIVDIERRCGQG
jgi:hypothetical protein